MKDKHGLTLEEHDLIKVFHYKVGRRKFYMYKQVIKRHASIPLLACSHLDGTDSWFDIRSLKPEDVEIIQSPLKLKRYLDKNEKCRLYK